MGEIGGRELNKTIKDRYFDLTMKVLNYAIEFVDQPSYASLRLTDILESLIDLSNSIEGVDDKEFYQTVKTKFNNRILMATPQDNIAFLDDLLNIYVNEWKKRK